MWIWRKLYFSVLLVCDTIGIAGAHNMLRSQYNWIGHLPESFRVARSIWAALWFDVCGCLDGILSIPLPCIFPLSSLHHAVNTIQMLLPNIHTTHILIVLLIIILHSCSSFLFSKPIRFEVKLNWDLASLYSWLILHHVQRASMSGFCTVIKNFVDVENQLYVFL